MLAPEAAAVSGLSFSPDGSYLYFIRSDKSTFNYSYMYKMASLGGAAAPLGYQRGLAIARRGIDENELGPGLSEPPDERGPLHPPVARLRRVELALQRDVDGGCRVGGGVNGPPSLRRPSTPVRLVPLQLSAQARIVTDNGKRYGGGFNPPWVGRTAVRAGVVG